MDVDIQQEQRMNSKGLAKTHASTALMTAVFLVYNDESMSHRK